jgi:hypothetical protein
MSKGKPSPAASAVEPFVMLTRGLLSSDAWRSLGINGWRFVNFLLLEHMGKAGTQNGKLKAPHRQLESFGIGRRHIADAIREAEGLGLVECRRAGLRAASTYTLTWLPLPDGAPASDFWRGYRNPNLRPLSTSKPKNLQSEGVAAVQYEGVADQAFLQSDGVADRAKGLPSEGVALLRKFLPGQVGYLSKKVRGASAATLTASPAAARKLRLIKAAATEIAPGSAARGGRS